MSVIFWLLLDLNAVALLLICSAMSNITTAVNSTTTNDSTANTTFTEGTTTPKLDTGEIQNADETGNIGGFSFSDRTSAVDILFTALEIVGALLLTMAFSALFVNIVNEYKQEKRMRRREQSGNREMFPLEKIVPL